MAASNPFLYNLLRRVLELALGFYFRRMETFHANRVPAMGPVLFASNHPNSLTDSFVIGASVRRKVNFVATVQLFRFAPLKWLLTQCGVIPINRVKDDPRAMRTIAGTFEACFRVLEAGEAVGIFPEGITYDDSQLKEVKSGAARMALELEARHGGKLGLVLAPVGLTYSAKEIYRSEVLANFGEPILVAPFLSGYAERRKECISRLTAELEKRLQGLILHLPQLEQERLVAAIKRLYLPQIRLGQRLVNDPISHQAEELLLTQKIASAVEHVVRTQPSRAEAFSAKLSHYEGWLKRLQLSDEDVAIFPEPRKLAAQSFGWGILAVLGAPIALYGWVHRFIPFAVVRWASKRFTEPMKRKAQASTVAIAAGIVAFGVCFGLFVALFHLNFGWPASLWYALSLPVASLVAHYYLVRIRHLAASLRNSLVLLRAPVAARRLLQRRRELIAEIESVRREMPSESISAKP
jgi:glycerol-3-phosphate O-acyltransferase / dihydroxyacetone phosphate acyltransferase